MVLDFGHFHAVEVEAHHQALDRPRVAVVVWITLAHEGQRPDQPAFACIVLWAVVAKRPGVDHHLLEVGYPSLAHRFLPAGVVPDRLLCGQNLLEHDRRLHAWTLPPGTHLSCGDGYHGLESLSLSPVPQDHEGLAVDGLPRLKAEDRVLVRF